MNRWKLIDNAAEIALGDVRLSMDPRQPSAGVRIVHGATTWGPLLQVTCDPPHSQTVDELYQRDDDLVVRFRQTEADQFAFQLDWRTVPGSIPGFELWFSIQTTLLDSHPRLLATLPAPQHWRAIHAGELAPAQLRDAEMDALPADATLGWLAASAPVPMAVLVHPVDLQQVVAAAQQDDPNALKLQVFGQFLEKGVIRRARLRVHFVSPSVTDEEFGQLVTQFAGSPLPLTA
ncbi:MAG: hypothetical protein D6753_15960 [Planctomycetota bacterium]|nr:MAG: hypothetical protein D6753_15960 [Planctomycetota bacterium]